MASPEQERVRCDLDRRVGREDVDHAALPMKVKASFAGMPARPNPTKIPADPIFRDPTPLEVRARIDEVLGAEAANGFQGRAR